MIYLAADHRGYKLKEKIKKHLATLGYQAQDLGAHKYNKQDDYPDFGSKAARKVSEKPKSNKAIMICGSGIGMDILANKFKGVRSALVHNTKMAKMSREHNNANVLNLPADFVSENVALQIVKVWLETEFSGQERHARRLRKIE